MVRATGVGVIDSLSLSLSHARALRQCGESQVNDDDDDGGLIFVVINFCLVSSQPPFLKWTKKKFCPVDETLENDDDDDIGHEKKGVEKVINVCGGGRERKREKKHSTKS